MRPNHIKTSGSDMLEQAVSQLQAEKATQVSQVLTTSPKMIVCLQFERCISQAHAAAYQFLMLLEFHISTPI